MPALSVARIDLSTAVGSALCCWRAAEIDVEAAQAVGDSPLEHRRVRGGEARRQRGEQRERARLVARLDDESGTRLFSSASSSRRASGDDGTAVMQRNLADARQRNVIGVRA